MRKPYLPVLAGVLVLGLCSCSEGPRDQIARHLDDMVSLLEEHKTSVDAAADAVEAYVREHAAELKAVREAIAKRQSELKKPDDLADYAGELLVRIGPILERAHGLMEAHPEIGRSERLRKALLSIGDL